MTPFVSQTQRPAVDYATKGVMPPAALATTTSDLFVIRIWNSASSIAVRAVLRLLLATGEVVTNEFDFSPDATRAANTFTFQLFEGFLLSAHVYTTTNGIRRGMCYVQVALHVGQLAQLISGQLLAEGYITTGTSLAFPYGPNGYAFESHGNMRSITGSTPAAGGNISETVPTNAIWRLVSFKYALAASAAAGNRTTLITITDGTTNILQFAASTTVPPTITYTFQWSDLFQAQSFAANTNSCYLPMSQFMPAGFKILTATLGLDAADQYGAPQYLVEEWIQP